MLRKFAAALLAALLLRTFPTAVSGAENDNAENSTSAEAAVVMELLTGRVLYSYRGEERRAQASTTKIMTTLLALEEPDIDTYFTVDSGAIHVEGSSMGLQEGDQVSLRQLCYGMMLPSGNDAANATAVRLAGSLPEFAKRMNERAMQLGLENTAFVTPSGLDAEGHYTSAVELAELARYAMGDETFRKICGQYTAKVKFGNPPFERWLKNYNKLLDFYEPCIGIKTGFTDNAGRVLVSAAAKDGVELICVTMDDGDDWADHQNLYERFFAECTPTSLSGLFPEKEVAVAGGTGPAAVQACGEMIIPLLPGELERLEVEWVLPPFEYAPVEKGQYAGEARLLLDGEPIHSYPLSYRADVEPVHPYQPGIMERIKEFFRSR